MFSAVCKNSWSGFRQGFQALKYTLKTASMVLKVTSLKWAARCNGSVNNQTLLNTINEQQNIILTLAWLMICSMHKLKTKPTSKIQCYSSTDQSTQSDCEYENINAMAFLLAADGHVTPANRPAIKWPEFLSRYWSDKIMSRDPAALQREPLLCEHVTWSAAGLSLVQRSRQAYSS